MHFVTPEEIKEFIDLDSVCIEVNMLLTDKLKLQTIHNHSAKALKDKDISTYLEKSLTKACFKYLSRHQEGES